MTNRIFPLFRWLLFFMSCLFLALNAWCRATSISASRLLGWAILFGVASGVCGLYSPKEKYSPESKKFISILLAIAAVFAVISLVLEMFT